MIKFHIPDFFLFRNLNHILLDLLAEYPEWFYDNISIHAIYGTFPGAIWNGGRISVGSTDLEEIREITASFNERGIALRHTFTNSILQEKHLYDNYCNNIMEITNNGKNEVLINSPILEEYLKKEYPNFKYIVSTTKGIRDFKAIEECTEKYDMIVTDYRDNRNYEALESIKNKDKVELLLNSACNPNCVRHKVHYDFMSQQQIKLDKSISFECPTLKRNLNFYDLFDSPLTIRAEEIYSIYAEMGFKNFKIEGRGWHIINTIESYIYYMIKPEYKEYARIEFLKRVW